jgi:peptidoglycan/LPS O-acetylase OafA/YrhL
MTVRQPVNRVHIPALDAVRGAAILLVLICHYTLPLADYFETPPGRAFYSLLNATRHGVDLFFVLSGFLITGILLASREEVGYFRNFIARRTLRIFPLYYAVLMLVLVIAPRFVPFSASDIEELEHNQWSLWTYTSNLLMFHTRSWQFQWTWFDLSHFWSLAIEEQFYLAWPLIVLMLPPKWVGRLCVVFFVGAATLRGILVHQGIDPMAVAVFTPCRIDALAAGAYLAVLDHRPKRLVTLDRFAPWIAVCLIPIIGLVFAMAYSRPVLVQVAKYSLLAVFFACFVVLARTAIPNSLAERVIARKWLIFLGKYSYGIYVFHGLLRPIFLHYIGPDRFVEWIQAPYLLATFCYGVAASAMAIAVSVLSYHAYEKRFLKLKRFFQPQRSWTNDSSVPSSLSERESHVRSRK